MVHMVNLKNSDCKPYMFKQYSGSMNNPLWKIT